MMGEQLSVSWFNSHVLNVNNVVVVHRVVSITTGESVSMVLCSEADIITMLRGIDNAFRTHMHLHSIP